MRIFVDPTYSRTDNGDGGIRRVSEALHRYLPELGIECVATPDEAEIINNHGASLTSRPSVPEVHSCHGLYWERYPWDNWAHDVNKLVAESMSRAVAHTAPSRWVGDAMRRGMLVYPEVIYHGVDSELWQPADSMGYVLWNKARTDPVSNPYDMQRVAALMPGVQFVSTFGAATSNVKVIGRATVEAMLPIVAQAGVYLATARETFGIGTLEALACGVPVAGWDYAGQHEIVTPGETGYLAPYGDYEALAACIARCLDQRERLSANARADAQARWQWKPRIAQYAALFERVYAREYAPRPRASIIVTSHNLGKYLPECLDSVAAQTAQDWECVIVDDDSGDNTPEVGNAYHARDPRFVYARTPRNLKLPGALNFGIARATGRYIMNLDGDNTLDPLAVEVLAAALDADAGIHIAYGHLDITAEDGTRRTRNPGWPPPAFEWRAQMGHLNMLHSSSMFRRDVWERVGGYRERMWRAEDAEFWSRVTSFGFRAKKVTELSTLIYRDRGDSKSKSEGGDGNWLAWLPWAYAGSAREGGEMFRAGKGPNIPRVPWGAQGPCPAAVRFWDVPDHSEPLVSVIIPVGPGHARYVLDALDSLVAQTFTGWEAIVVYDDGTAPQEIMGAPYARVLHTEGRQGPGRARNLGAKSARGEVLYFLDADDYLLPQTLEKMWGVYQQSGYLIYGDWLRCNSARGSGTPASLFDTHESDDFSPGATLRQMQHSINVMVPRAAHEAIGGFDEAMKGWEDWDYLIALQAVAHLCSVRLPEPLFVYRFHVGGRREESFNDGRALKAYIRNKWASLYSGEESIMCGCNKGKTLAQITGAGAAAAAAYSGAGGGSELLAGTSEAVLVEYMGVVRGPISVKGPASDRIYRFGLDEGHKVKWVLRPDAAELLERTTRGVPQFRTVQQHAPPARVEPPPVPVAEFVAPPTSQEPDLPALGFPSMDDPEPLPELPTNGHEPEPDGPRAVDVTALSVRTVRDQIEAGVPIATLLQWRMQESQAATPRKSVLAALAKALRAAQQVTA